MAFMGRDHSPDAFTMWMAGAGVKGGYSYGVTDPVGYTPGRESCAVTRPTRDPSAPDGL